MNKIAKFWSQKGGQKYRNDEQGITVPNGDSFSRMSQISPNPNGSQMNDNNACHLRRENLL